MWNLVEQAGPVGYILVVVSVLSWGVVLERIWFWIGHGGRLSREKRGRVIAAFHAGDRRRIESLLERERSPEAAGVRLLYNYRASRERSPVDIAVSREVAQTSRWLGVLDVNGTVAPMLGILGTVVGIIQAFQGMKGAVPDTAVMTAGLSVSMLTTAIGLVVALASIIPYNLLAAKAHRYQTELAEFLHECWLGRCPDDARPATGTAGGGRPHTEHTEQGEEP